jgi:hypothetical protein
VVTRKPAPGSYGRWSAERLALVPGVVADPRQLRADYIGWCSDRRLGWLPMSKQRAAIKAFGGRYSGTKDKVQVHDVMALPLVDSGYRALSRVPPGELGEHVDPSEALLALWEEALVTDLRALDIAWLRLSGEAVARICRACGMVTRRAEAIHAGCVR